MTPDDPLDYPARWAERLEELRSAFCNGDKGALLRCIYFCFQFEQPVPEWASRAYQDAFASTLGGDARSWDDAFGSPQPGKKHLYKMRTDALRWQIYKKVTALHDGGAALDDRLFALVGKEFGIGKSRASTLYYRVKRALQRLTDDNPSCREK